MFKKTVLTLGLALLLTGCQIPGVNQKSDSTSSDTPATIHSENYQELAQAVINGQAVRCVTTHTADQTSFTTTFKGSKIKTTGLAAANNSESEGPHYGTALIDGQTMYIWDENQKSGMIFTIDEATAAEGQQAYLDRTFDLNDPALRQNWEEQGFSMQCAHATVSDAEMSAPSDVTFTNLSALQDLTKSFDPENLEGSTVDQAELMKQLESLVQSTP